MTPDLPSSPILDAYLAELEHAAADLPVAQRAELLADIRAHVAAACAESADDPAGAIPAILAQLGDPAEIAAAARADLPPAPAAAPVEQRPAGPGVLEALALVLLLVCGLGFWLLWPLPWIGWLTGLVLLCVSRHWSLRDKLIGFAGAGLAPLLLSAMVFVFVGTTSCTASSTSAPVVTATTVQGGTVTSIPLSTSAMDCTQGQAIPPAVAIVLALALVAGLALALRHLSRTGPRTTVPA